MSIKARPLMRSEPISTQIGGQTTEPVNEASQTLSTATRRLLPITMIAADRIDRTFRLDRPMPTHHAHSSHGRIYNEKAPAFQTCRMQGLRLRPSTEGHRKELDSS